MHAREPALELRIELEPHDDGRPPRGWLSVGAAPRRRFESYVQLIALLEQLRTGAHHHAPARGRT
jgi:hypothetical protein